MIESRHAGIRVPDGGDMEHEVIKCGMCIVND